MVYKVVSTKLTEEEHSKFLDTCNQEGLTPSALIKESIMMRIDPDYFLTRMLEMMDASPDVFTQVTEKIQQKTNENKQVREWNIDDLKKALGMKDK